MDEDGFILVSKKKSAKAKKLKNPQFLFGSDEEGDVESSCKKVFFFRDVLSREKDIADFLSRVKQELNQQLSPIQRLLAIVCYGLGKVSSCQIAQIQFSFLLLLREHLEEVDVEAYDPAFSITDKTLLKNFHVNLINGNEEAKRTVEDGKIVFYMPHCDFFLCNNLLWANWSEQKLKNLVLIANSLKTAVHNHISRNFNAKYKYICMAEKLSTEYAFPVLKNNFECFNNLSLIIFSSSDDKSIWNILTEPTYSDDELS